MLEKLLLGYYYLGLRKAFYIIKFHLLQALILKFPVSLHLFQYPSLGLVNEHHMGTPERPVGNRNCEKVRHWITGPLLWPSANVEKKDI